MLKQGPGNRRRRIALISNATKAGALSARLRIKRLKNFRTKSNGEMTNNFNSISALWRSAERVVLIFSIFAFLLGLYIFKEEADDRKRSAVNTAWSNISTPSGANSGKREAIEYLLSQGVDLWGIDLSCQKMDAGWNDVDKSCAKPVFLVGLQFSPIKTGNDAHEWVCEHQQRGKLRSQAPNFGGIIQVQSANFDGANLTCANFNGVDVTFSSFTAANLSLSEFSNSKISANFDHAEINGANFKNSSGYGANFHGAKLDLAQIIQENKEDVIRTDFSYANLTSANFSESIMAAVIFKFTNLSSANMSSSHLFYADFQGAQLSSTDFTSVRDIDTASFRDAWAWADKPPIALPKSINILLCEWKEGLDRATKPRDCN